MAPVNFSNMPDVPPVTLEAEHRELTIQWALDMLLHSRNCVPQDALICLEVNGIFLGNGGFVCTVFRAKNQEPDFPHLEFLANLRAMASRIYDKTGVHHVVPMDGQLVVLSCFPRLTPAQHREDQLADLTGRLSRQVCDLCRTHWGVEVLPVVSQVVYTLDRLSDIYCFVTDLMEYKLFIGDDSQCIYEPARLHTGELVDNTAAIQKKAAFLANALYTEAPLDPARYAAELVAFMVESDVSSLRNLHVCLLTFVQRLAKELLQLGAADTEFLTRQDMLGRLFQATRRQTLVQALTQTIAEIQQHMQRLEQNRSLQKILAVRAYIDQNFTDQNLSLGQLSELAGLHASSVSSLFKKQFGMTVLTYIRRRRVARAKQLLADPGNTLAQVADGAGFGSLNSMYRAFQAQEGIPPGQLR